MTFSHHRNFGLTSRPGAGAVDRPAGSIAPGGWRNSIDSVGLCEGVQGGNAGPRVVRPHSPSSDGGVGVRHANTGNMPATQTGEETRWPLPALSGRTVRGAAIQPCAGVTPGPSDSIQSAVANISSPSRHYGAQMRRILSQPVLGQRPQPANDERNSEPDEERHDRHGRPCDAWQLPHVRSPFESLPAGFHPVLKRRDITQSPFEKRALLFALLFFVSVLMFLGGFIAFLRFVES